MPYLTREERDVMDRDALRQGLSRRIREDVERASPNERKEMLDSAVAELRSALDSGNYAQCDVLGERLYLTSSAVEWADWREQNRLHSAAMPSVLPEELPAGTPIFYGTHHGKRFDGVARLVTYQSALPGYTHWTCRDYVGNVDGRKAHVSADHIDWRRINQ